MIARTRLAVLGSPIGHSKSPALHTAAYAELGLPWSYDAIEIDTGTLAGFLRDRNEEWRGLSLTMPLKRDVLPLLDRVDELVELTGSANTVLIGDDGGGLSLRGYNTDVYGIVESMRDAGVSILTNVRLLGGGATAASALVAVAQLGGARVIVSVRNPSRAARLVALGERLGLVVEVETLGVMNSGFAADAVISTLPGGVEHGLEFDAGLRATSVFFDVAYEPWPTPLAASWLEVGGRVVPGIEMLVRQALVQVRVFLSTDPMRELPAETAVLAAMRSAVGLAATA
ncbi:MAG: shikimate dehydrogenase [Microbacteriaceae bacterium]|nr:shikimate dehydrogenase [Microbacteriaceae bacterium]